MEQQYQQASSVDYSLKDGETLVLQLKSVEFLTPSNELIHHILLHMHHLTPFLFVACNRKVVAA